MSDSRKYLARHLRSLSLQMMEESHRICRSLDPILEPTWGSILEQLDRHGRITVTEAAQKMGVSHVHAQKPLKAMKKALVVDSAPDPDDGRQTFYRLTERGRSLLPAIGLLSSAIDDVIGDIEAETGDSLFATLTSFQTALNSKRWSARVTKKLTNTED